jgi:uncharacterized protein YegJ (DUF2314 family)
MTHARIASGRFPCSIMKYFRNAGLLATVALLAALAACSDRDEIISIRPDDAEMNAAIAKARESLPQFWQVFEKRGRGESDFALKVKITDNNGTEHFWATDIERRDGSVRGTINNDPNIVAKVKLGDRLTIPEADISDWLYMRDGRMVGNHTLRVLVKKMSAREAEQYRKLMADPAE